MIFCNLKKITIYIQYIKILILVVGSICHLFFGGEGGAGGGEDLFFSFFFFFSFEELFLFPLGYCTFSGLELILHPSLPSIYRGKPGELGGL